MAVLDDAGELASSQCAELLLDLREDELDRVVLRAVWDVEDAPEAQPRHLCLRLVAPVSREIVHEQCNLLHTILVSELLQVFFELLDIHRVLEDPVVFLAVLLRNC